MLSRTPKSIVILARDFNQSHQSEFLDDAARVELVLLQDCRIPSCIRLCTRIPASPGRVRATGDAVPRVRSIIQRPRRSTPAAYETT